MIEYLVVTCDTNHRNYQRTTLRANDIDTAAIAAIHEQRNRFVVAVVEADHADPLGIGSPEQVTA